MEDIKLIDKNALKYSCGTDDITFCGNECENIRCYRNINNRLYKELPYSMSFFKDSDNCPSYTTETNLEIKMEKKHESK